MTEQEITKEFAPLCEMPVGRYSKRALKGELALPFPSLATRLVHPLPSSAAPSRT